MVTGSGSDSNNESLSQKDLARLAALFARPVAARGMSPLKDGVALALYVDKAGPVTLTKESGKPVVRNEPPAKADFTFRIASNALTRLEAVESEDLGEVGVEIAKLMANPDPASRIHASVHVGPFDLFLKGYLGIFPLGGATLMRHLASSGLTSLGKIKEALSRMKEDRR